MNDIPKLVVLVDADGTLNNLVVEYLRRANERFWLSLRIEDVTDYDMSLALPEALRSDPWRAWDEDGFVESLVPLDGAREAMEALRSDGHTVVAASAYMNPQSAKEKVEWLRRRMGFVERDIVLGWRKELLDGNVFIDDSPEMLVRWQDGHAGGLALGIEWPYNQGRFPLLSSDWRDPRRAWKGILNSIRAGFYPAKGAA